MIKKVVKKFSNSILIIIMIYSLINSNYIVNAAAVGNKNPKAKQNAENLINASTPTYKDYSSSAASNGGILNDNLTGNTVNGTTITGYDQDGYSTSEILYQDVLSDGSVYCGGNSKSGLSSTSAFDKDINDFTKILPYGNIYIDSNKLVFERDGNGEYKNVYISPGSPFKVISNGDAEIIDENGNTNTTRTYVDANSSIYYYGGITSYINGIGGYDQNGYLEEGKLEILATQGDSITGASSVGHSNVPARYVGSTKIEVIDGQNIITATGDYLYKIVYKDAAVLKDGSRANLVLTVDKIIIETSVDEAPGKIFRLQGNDQFGFNDQVKVTDGTTESYVFRQHIGKPGADTTDKAGVGKIGNSKGGSIDWNISVQDSNGNKIEGSIAYAARDLDLPSAQSHWGRQYGYEYSEGMAVKEGALSYAVIPYYEYANGADLDNGWIINGDNPLVISRTASGAPRTANGIRFNSRSVSNIRKENGELIRPLTNNSPSGISRTIKSASNVPSNLYSLTWNFNRNDSYGYDTGFATMLDASGSKLNWTASVGRGIAGSVNTFIFDSTAFAKVEQSHGTGGDIYIEEYKINYDQNGSPVSYDPVEYKANGLVLGIGSYTTVTLRPKTGYWVNDVTIDGKIYTFKNDGIYLGNTKISSWDSDNKITLSNADHEEGDVIVEKNSDGTYDVTFQDLKSFYDANGNLSPYKIHVDFDADHYFIKNWIPEDTTSLTLTAKAYTFNGTSLVYAGASKDVTFTVNKTDANVIEKNTITGGTQWIIKKSDLPIEPEDSVHTADHDNPYYWFITETVPANYTLKEYDNSSITHTSYYDKSGENTTWQTKARAITTGAYASVVRDGGEITNIMYKDLTVEKIVTGNLADTEKEFIYTITVYNGDTAITDNLTINKGGTSTLIDNGGTFTLKHGETATIEDIVKGYNYTIAEADTDYEESYKVIKTGDNTVITNTTTGTTITKQVLNEDQTVTYTNNKEENIITGVVIKNLPYIILGTIGLMGILVNLFIRRKKFKK